MPRKPPPVLDLTRKLKGSKIWNGIVWMPGDEANLPADFPEDGPWWADWEDDPELTLAQQKAAFGEQETTADEVPEVEEFKADRIAQEQIEKEMAAARERASGNQNSTDAMPVSTGREIGKRTRA